VRLPDGEGVILAKTLRKRASRQKILLTSTDRTAVSPGLLRGSGASGFIPKSELTGTDLDRFLKS
jgi:DNA-binding NarL/FixJ family response regulator